MSDLPTVEKDVLHYCGHPERQGEPALCGMTREPDAEPHMIAWRTTTRGPDVTCAACLAILEGRPIPPGAGGTR